jgi:hypothetical protein
MGTAISIVVMVLMALLFVMWVTRPRGPRPEQGTMEDVLRHFRGMRAEGGKLLHEGKRWKAEAGPTTVTIDFGAPVRDERNADVKDALVRMGKIVPVKLEVSGTRAVLTMDHPIGEARFLIAFLEAAFDLADALR